MRAPFSKGFFVGGAIACAMTITKGNFPGGKWDHEPDTKIEMDDSGLEGLPGARQRAHVRQARLGPPLRAARPATMRRTTVRIQSHVPLELAKTTEKPCPAQVYEIPDDQLELLTR